MICCKAKPYFGVLQFAIEIACFPKTKSKSGINFLSKFTYKNSRTHSMYEVIERGTKYTSDYRVFLKNEDAPLSTWHDIPLYNNVNQKFFNMIVEIPRWTNAKVEINKAEVLNPIAQDIKKGKPRFVHNVFPHHGYIWNYGAFPQTWENPEVLDPLTGYKGDNDPLDVIEIGEKISYTGEILNVKVLGALALLDEGETDWKIVAINIQDPLAEKLNEIQDVEKHMPGLLHATVEWFRLYKIPDGKPRNSFAFGGEFKTVATALEVIETCNKEWLELMSGKILNSNISLVNTSSDNSHYISTEGACSAIEKCSPLTDPAPIDSSVSKWHYLQLV